MRGGVRIPLLRAVRVALHPMKRQRLDRIGRRGVDIHLLAESVGVEQERPAAIGLERRKRGRIERQGDLVAGPRNDEHVVAPAQQLANVPFARIPSGHRLPDDGGRNAIVVVAIRLAAVGRRFRRESAPAQHRDGCLGARLTGAEINRRRIHEDLIPVDPHVGDDPNLPLARAELAAQVDDDRLRPADGDADVRKHGTPCAGCGFDFERRRLERQPLMMRGDVIAGKRIVRPTRRHQHRARRRRTEIEPQLVTFCIAADLRQREIIRVLAIQMSQAIENVVSVVIRRRLGWPRTARQRDEPFGRGCTQPLIRKDVRAARMVDRHELETVDEQRLLELVGDAQLVAAVLLNE